MPTKFPLLYKYCVKRAIEQLEWGFWNIFINKQGLRGVNMFLIYFYFAYLCFYGLKGIMNEKATLVYLFLSLIAVRMFCLYMYLNGVLVVMWGKFDTFVVLKSFIWLSWKRLLLINCKKFLALWITHWRKWED